jgi:hypothetical protein
MGSIEPRGFHESPASRARHPFDADRTKCSVSAIGQDIHPGAAEPGIR